MNQWYPAQPIDPYPPPPVSFSDNEDRDIAIHTYGKREETTTEDGGGLECESLVDMYLAFDPADRAQGIPPVGEPAIRDWLETILRGEAVNVVAWQGDTPVGHATLVPDGTGGYELAIFVVDAYQEAGIGTHLMEALLGEGRRQGVERVWLTVEPWNTAAYHLYEKVGFERSTIEGFEVQMAARLQ